MLNTRGLFILCSWRARRGSCSLLTRLHASPPLYAEEFGRDYRGVAFWKTTPYKLETVPKYLAGHWLVFYLLNDLAKAS